MGKFKHYDALSFNTPLLHDAQPIFQVADLSRTVEGRVLWQDVSLRLFAGDVLGLISPSGTGKTLLLRQLVLLDPLQTGHIQLRGQSPSQWTIPIYRTKVIYLSQRPTIFPGTGLDNLQQPFGLGVYRQRSFNLSQVELWLKKLGRGLDFLDRPGTQLSGGEGQILALLRTLQLDPDILLLDEPTASLDPVTTTQVEQLLEQWIQQPGKACLFTSHDHQQMQRFSHQQLDLRNFAP